MKSIFHKIIILSFMLVLTSLQISLGANVYAMTLEEQLGNYSQTQLVHDGSVLILNQTTQKLSYKIGENITINTELINMGNKTVEIAYCEPWIALEIKNQTGDEIWPNSQLACIPEFSGKKTLQPGEHLSEKPWGFTMQPNVFPSPRLYIPGNYTVVSVAVFTFDMHTKNLDSVESLWSKPLPVTVLSEMYSQNQTDSIIPKIPEFPFAIPILLASFVSVIALSRMRFRN